MSIPSMLQSSQLSA